MKGRIGQYCYQMRLHFENTARNAGAAPLELVHHFHYPSFDFEAEAMWLHSGDWVDLCHNWQVSSQTN